MWSFLDSIGVSSYKSKKDWLEIRWSIFLNKTAVPSIIISRGPQDGLSLKALLLLLILSSLMRCFNLIWMNATI